MADKSVGELIAATSVTPTDLFVLEQNGTAKKVTGQILENWLVSFANGHGGIQSIKKIGTDVLSDTYRITLADTTTFDFVVTNGKGISNVVKTETSGLVDTYTITYNDGTKSTFTVTNGEKGDKGDRADIWVKYASQKPTASSHSFGDVPDAWIGIATGHNMDAAPTDWQVYTWFQWKGEKGDTGDPATLISFQVTYQVGDSGTVIPSGSWTTSVPPVTPGKFLWTRQVLQFNTGAPITSYSVSRFGIDGTGAVSTVAGVAPDINGNVPLDASGVKALPIGGGTMEGAINMNGQKLSGLNAPTKDDEAATKGYADELKNDTETYVNNAVRTAAKRNLLDNSYFANPVNQRGVTAKIGRGIYTLDRWVIDSENGNGYFDVKPGVGIGLNVNGDSWMTVFQRISGLDQNKQYTIAFMDGAGIIHVNESSDILWGNGHGDVRLNLGSGIRTVVWAALYEGEYTIDTLPEYQPKGYGAELAECQRYLQRFRTETERKTYCEDFRPTMHLTPNGVVSKFEQNIDGVTYYFASAEL